MPTNTGVYTQEDASVGHIHSENLCNKLSEILDKNEPIIDIGCGRGDYVKSLNAKGFNVKGIDGIKLDCHDDNIYIFDLTKPFIIDNKCTVMSLEVGEHIPKQYENIFIDNLINNCNGKLILSWAIEGQAGIGHINCKNNDYIINCLKDRRFIFNQEITDNLRNVVEDNCDYFRNTLMFFEKSE